MSAQREPHPHQPLFRPLYQQIRESVVKRIASGEWPPGTFLPSEMALAQEYGVSQGTLRKALDELATDGLLVRRQGKGTAVATHDSDRSLFRFFHLVNTAGERVLPTSRVLRRSVDRASAEETHQLQLAAHTRVLRIHRVRELDGMPVMLETVSLDGTRFSALRENPPTLPNTLYDLYQRRFGISVARAMEQLYAVAAGAEESASLGLPPGTPLLEIRRLAIDLEGKPVEWRVSRCSTACHHYVNELD